MTENKRKKTTMEQRLIMLQYMEEHPDFAQNKIVGLDAKKQIALLSEELTKRLNSVGNGVQKSSDKWIKSWRDWRVDVKSKAAKLKNYQRGTGGGGPSPAPLHEIEERLIALMGIESVEGHLNIIDPAEPQNEIENLRSTSTLKKSCFQSSPSLTSSLTIQSRQRSTPLSSQFSQVELNQFSTVQSIPSLVDPDTNIYSIQQENIPPSSNMSSSSLSSYIYSHSSTQSDHENQSESITRFPSSSPSCKTVLRKIRNTTEFKKKKEKGSTNFDAQVLNEMQAQTIALKNLTNTMTNIARYIKGLVNANLISDTNIEEEETIYENEEYLN